MGWFVFVILPFSLTSFQKKPAQRPATSLIFRSQNKAFNKDPELLGSKGVVERGFLFFNV